MEYKIGSVIEIGEQKLTYVVLSTTILEPQEEQYLLVAPASNINAEVPNVENDKSIIVKSKKNVDGLEIVKDENIIRKVLENI